MSIAKATNSAAAEAILEEMQELQAALWDKACELEHILDLDIDDLTTRDLAGLSIEDLLD